MENGTEVLDAETGVQKYQGSDMAAMELSIEAMKQRVVLVKRMYDSVMVNGVDYGKIPGCGDKPVLLKGGAEKLGMLFKLSPSFSVTRDNLESGHREYHITCNLVNTHGAIVASADASASTLESKHRYRGSAVVCPACGKETIIRGRKEYGGGWLCYAAKGGCGTKFRDGDGSIEGQATGRAENKDIADTYNTVLKMGEKRAFVAAILFATGASSYFTQDIEDAAKNDVAPKIEPAEPARPKQGETTIREPGDDDVLDAPELDKHARLVGIKQAITHGDDLEREEAWGVWVKVQLDYPPETNREIGKLYASMKKGGNVK